MGRADRLQERFKMIQRTLEELYGRDKAFGAATASWLMAIQYMATQSFLRLSPPDLGAGDYDPQEYIAPHVEELERILQSFHGELCEHLGVNQAEAWEYAKAFKQVIDDICYQGG